MTSILHLLVNGFVCKEHRVHADRCNQLNGGTWKYAKHTRERARARMHACTQTQNPPVTP